MNTPGDDPIGDGEGGGGRFSEAEQASWLERAPGLNLGSECSNLESDSSCLESDESPEYRNLEADEYRYEEPPVAVAGGIHRMNGWRGCGERDS